VYIQIIIYDFLTFLAFREVLFVLFSHKDI